MITFQLIVVGIYGTFLLFIFLYSLTQFNLVLNYFKGNKNRANQLKIVSEKNISNFPLVTIQLPIFNEKYVIERLIDTVIEFDYPKDKIEIQVLDDSTDDTVEIVAQKVAQVKAKGFDIKHITRTERKGYKAGALKEGMEIAKGEFIAIFDADFVPKKDFLLVTIPPFQDKKVGVVQTKWEHLNQNYSILTQLQAFGLDAHFTVEQRGRSTAGHFINFNGTAGVWRKTCIEDAGGWEADTLTEDLDLSYRAQLKGWKFEYIEVFGSPAELPASMNALKAQQHRWTKGAAECTKKNLKRVLLAKSVSFSTKLHAIFHLMNSFLFICIIGTALLSVPVLMLKQELLEYAYIFKYGTLFGVSFICLSLFYLASIYYKNQSKLTSFLEFLIKFPLFLSVSMGLSLHNAIAVLEGYAGQKSPFVRTPKFNIVKKGDKWINNKYRSKKINFLTLFEGLLVGYFSYGIYLAFQFNDFGLVPFHAMLIIGFGIVFYYSIAHSRNLE